VEWVDAEDPLFLLYTSGSTGKPKVVLTLNLVDCSSTPLTKLSTYYEPYRVLHTTGGYMVYSATTFKHAFDYKPGDVYW